MRLAVGAALATLIAAGATAAAEPTFEAWWHDGRAELDGYRLQVSRYGAPRRAQAVMVFVTEPFSASHHVKLDDPSIHRGDAVDVLKLNLVRDFQTGIYDYNTMVSLFVRTSDFRPVKLAFSSAEWCGQVYEECDFRGGRVSQQVSSYFEGESGRKSLPFPAGGLVEDALFVVLRGLRGPVLEAGRTRRVPLLSSPFARRLGHSPAAWGEASISRRSRPERVSVPAGSFDADVYEVVAPDGRTGTFHVERAYPHRVVRWEWTRTSAGGKPLAGVETGELTGTSRLEYWKRNAPGDERLLDALGIEPTVPPRGR